MGSGHFADLPPEILTAICSHLPRRELKAARLTSRTFTSITSPFLFRIAFLRVGLNSFRNLQKIANHPSLCQHVRVISYDPWIMKNTTASVAVSTYGTADMFRLWKMYDLERGLRKSKLSDESLRPLFENWLARVADLEALSPLLEYEILMDIMRKLPMLHGLQYDLFATGELHAYSGTGQSVWEISTNAHDKSLSSGRKTRKEAHQETVFWRLMEVAQIAGRADHILKCKAADLDMSFWNSMGQRRSLESITFPNLNSIDLQFENCSSTTGQCLQRFLTAAPLLQHLALSFKFLDSASYRYNRYIRLSDFVLDGQCWKDMKHISFRHLVASDAELRDFLERHRNSLQSLVLGDCLLHPGDGVISMRDEEAAQDRKGNEEVGSWLDMIEFLRTSLSLKRMRFGGILANGRNEAWKVSVPRMDVPGLKYEEFLKPRIENYICIGGDNPVDRIPSNRVAVEALSVKDFDTRGLQIPYIWEDDTWRLSVVELPRVHRSSDMN